VAGCGFVVAAVTGCPPVGVELARGCAGRVGSAEAVAVGVVLGAVGVVLVVPAALSAPTVATAWPPRLSVAAYTPAATISARATSPIVAVIRPVRKLISSSRALTAARRRD
jgi:hypothetical protein